MNCWERHDPNEPHVRGGGVLFIFSIYKLCTIHMTNGKTISNLLNNLVFTFQYTTFFKINLYIPIYLYYNSKVQTLKIRTRLGGGLFLFCFKISALHHVFFGIFLRFRPKMKRNTPTISPVVSLNLLVGLILLLIFLNPFCEEFDVL